MESDLKLSGSKQEVLGFVQQHLTDIGFKISSKDFNRPWGGFFVLDESQAAEFGKRYFPEVELSTLKSREA